MKKTLYFAAVAALSIMVSCQKEVSPATPIVFSASIDNPADTKVSVDMTDGKVSWVAGDEITISDGSNTGVYTANSAGATTNFTYKSGTEFTAAGNYTATYGTMPVAGVDQTYNATPGKLIHMSAPEIVVSASSITTADFHFTADCGLLKLNLTASGKSVKRIYVIDENGNDDYKLLCETAQSISEAKDFYIALPAGTYTKYIIRDHEGKDAVKSAKSGKGTVIVNNQIKPVTFESFDFKAPVYPESNTNGIKIGDIYWAPVNCGYNATSAPTGLFYQWGRKYGQANTGSVTLETTQASSMAEGNTEANKDKFYKGYACWYSGNSISDTWSSEYDPCPAGWRVSTAAELTLVKNSSTWVTNKDITGTTSGSYSGRLYPASGASQIFLPAARFRTYDNGTMYESVCGYYRSSTPSSDYADKATTLYFEEKDINSKIDETNRTTGFSVRCVQE